MDSDQFISFFQSSLNSPTLDTDYVSQWDTLAAQPLPQPLFSNQSLALLEAFCSDEDTVSSYLLDGDQLDNHNNLAQQFFDSSIENRPSSNDWTNPSDILYAIENLNSPTLDTDYTSQWDTLAAQPLPQPSCSNQSLALLNAFCSDENTVKSYLLDGNQSNNHNNAGRQFFDSSIENRPSSNDWTNPSDNLYAIENLNESTLDTDYASQCDTLAVQPLHQPSCANQSLALLKAFCSDEDTVKSYLLDGDQLNNNAGQQFLNSPIETLSSSTENCYKSKNPFNSLDAIEDLSPVATPISSYESTDPLAVESLYQSKMHNTYDNLKLNFISLLKSGYKLTLSLNTDNSEVDEPWNPDVSQKILSVYFSSLSLKSEYLSNDVKLDGFQSLLMEEAYVAFKGQKHLNLFSNLNDRRRAKASPDKLISICNGIKGFRKIETSDKAVLLSNIYNHLHLMEGIFNYDPTIDGWDAPAYDFKSDRRDTFLFNQFLHDEMVYVIETFPDRFRSDTNI
ncbi:uncharacterized protein LOC107370425 isoform X8 [Tetranychus urticae]|uniref:uncharacterized protein LOC107370425 isoform X8 n=1 Tax=Tetranychus urticae TaxID=32264 RepID=UPI000D64FBFD|nr:uncharacterized protein LOC107370425 isoform X8 [Tetranychus urticae]